MTLDETRTLLEKARQHDGRIIITDAAITNWQQALIHHNFEHTFDAVFDHFDQCGPRIQLNPAEVLHHLQKAREARDAEARKQRDLERNESVFGAYHDHRQPWEIDAAREAAHAGRVELERTLAARRPEQAAS